MKTPIFTKGISLGLLGLLTAVLLGYQNCGKNLSESSQESLSLLRQPRGWSYTATTGNPVQTLIEKAACSDPADCKFNWDQWNYHCVASEICCGEGQTAEVNKCRETGAPEDFIKGVDTSTNRGGQMSALEYWNCFTADNCEAIVNRLKSGGDPATSPHPSPSAGPSPSPGVSRPPVPQTMYCGTPGNPANYTGFVQLVKAQYKQTFASLTECNAVKDAIFRNAYTCSKIVSGSGFWCAGVRDGTRVVLEAIVPLPELKSGGLESPYVHYFNGVNCDQAKTFLNNFTNQLQPLMGNFTDRVAVISGDCHDATTAILKVESYR